MDIKRFIGGWLEGNCYVIANKKREEGKGGAAGRPCFIIDPGYNAKKILRYIEEANLDVQGILLTHHHSDHTGAVEPIRKELGCPVMMHRADVDMYGGHVDRYLEDGDVLQLDGEVALQPDGGQGCGHTVTLTVLHTPGHTKGGVCFMDEKEKVCFTGDTIFNVDLGRTDLKDGSYMEMVSSIKNVVDKWPNDITIYPGHGDPATMKRVRAINLEFLDITEGEDERHTRRKTKE